MAQKFVENGLDKKFVCVSKWASCLKENLCIENAVKGPQKEVNYAYVATNTYTSLMRQKRKSMKESFYMSGIF